MISVADGSELPQPLLYTTSWAQIFEINMGTIHVELKLESDHQPHRLIRKMEPVGFPMLFCELIN
jgi:hypothetical protein